MNSRRAILKFLSMFLLCLAAGVFRASATTTQYWEVGSFEDFQKGDFEGTAVNSAGEVRTGWDTVRRELPEDASVWSFAEGAKGDIFLGTGNRGALYLLRENKLIQLTETECVVLTAVETDKKGNVYAAGMPGAEVYRFTPQTIKKLVKEASPEAKAEWKKREYKSDKKDAGKDKGKGSKEEPGGKKVSEDKPAAGSQKKEGAEGEGEGEGKGEKEKPPAAADKELKPAGGEEGSTGGKGEGGKDEKGQVKGEGKKKEGKEAGKAKEKEAGEGKEKGKVKKEKKEEKKEKKRVGPEPWVKLEDADQVWSLMMDESRNLLFAGTGPKGKVYSIDASGRANLFADTGEEHVLALADLGDGKIAAGTGNKGRLLLLEGPGRGSVLWDFQATEVKSVVRLPREGSKQGVIVCAVNKFKSVPPLSVSKPSMSTMAKAGAKQPSKGPSLEGEGKVAAIFEGGGMRVLYEDKSNAFTFLEASKKEERVLAGDAQKGRIYGVDLEGNYSILFDLDERQVLSFCMECSNPFIGTSDPAAVHRIVKSPPATPYYVSDVFDAGFPASWGKMILRSEGNISWQTRTGSTAEPDQWWADWSKPSTSSEGLVASKSGRFLQFRLKVAPDAAVWNARLYYLPANQQAVVKEIAAGDAGGSDSKGKKGGDKGADKGEEKHDPVIELKWTVDNPDGDVLQYTLFFAKEGEEIWVPILKVDEKLTDTKYKWDTTSIPAGYYLIKVNATDEPSNDPKFAISHSRVSKPVLVDNDPPQIAMSVGVTKDGIKASGKVTDNFSRVSQIQYSVDGKPWKDIFPEDLVFDDPIEPFSFKVSGLAVGAHTITVRAWDEARNLTSTGDNFVIKK
jgi:hypothetical protein